MSSRHRLIERPKGKGKVFRGDQFLTEAGYALSVRQEYLPSCDEMVHGHLEIDGTLSGRRTWEDLEESDDQPFTLEIEDGRRLNFLFVNSRTGKIKGTGDFY